MSSTDGTSEPNSPPTWRVRSSRNATACDVDSREEAEELAELVNWCDPVVECYVPGIGWVPASKVKD